MPSTIEIVAPERATMASIIESIGLEIEFANIPKANARDLARSIRWRLVEDGSTRNYRYALNSGLELSSGGYRMFGGEFVSPMLDTTNDRWLSNVKRIITWLRQHGEGVDARTSIHVHVNVTGFPLFALKYLFLIAAHLEAAMYRLACGEAGIHRGSLRNDYGYCRPLTIPGPPCTPTDTVTRPVFGLNQILNVQSWKEYRQAVGRYDRWGGGKYHEARYVWLNPLSFMVYGSIEFRLFNFTQRPTFVWAWVSLCKEIVRNSFAKRTILDYNPLGTTQIALEDVVEFLMLDNNLTYVLEELWGLSDFPPPVRSPQLGHIGHPVAWYGVRPEIIPPEPEELPREFGPTGFDGAPLVQGHPPLTTHLGTLHWENE